MSEIETKQTYKDPENVLVLLEKLEKLQTREEIQKFIQTYLPDWLVASTDAYSRDYNHLQINWETICLMNNVKPQKIVLVQKVVMYPIINSQYSLLKAVCELMTRRGYVVRQVGELTGCKVCQKAIPSRSIWERIKQRGIKVPEIWSTKCSGCKETNIEEQESLEDKNKE